LNVYTLTQSVRYSVYDITQVVVVNGVSVTYPPADVPAAVFYAIKGDTGPQGPAGSGGGGGAATVSVVSASYSETSTSGSKAVLCNAASGAIVVTLPTAVGNTATLTFKKIDASANTLTIDGAGSETVDGGLTAVLSTQFESITIVSDGANWSIL
jgi:hypothetical protein